MDLGFLWELLGRLLPFDCLGPPEWAVFRRTLVALMLLAPMLGLLGVQVVNARYAFFSDAVSHAALAGVGLGALLGLDGRWSLPLALLKTIGLQNNSPLPLSSFGRGVERVRQFWKEKGIDTGALWIYDGSGLSPIDKVSASFMVDVLLFMNTEASASEAFIRSIPQAGKEGTVVNFLRGTPLEGRARLKSGGMSRVKSYAGYITLNGEEYAVSLFVNNYRCEGREMTRALEKLLVSLF